MPPLEEPGMRYQQKGSRLEEAYFEMTPMLDIIFQMNIFFMVVINFGGINVSTDLLLPRAEYAIPPKNVQGSRVVLNLTRQHQWMASNRVLGPKELDETLRIEARVANRMPDGVTPDLTIVIRADWMAPYEKIAPVIEACAKVGIAKVAFMAIAPREVEE